MGASTRRVAKVIRTDRLQGPAFGMVTGAHVHPIGGQILLTLAQAKRRGFTEIRTVFVYYINGIYGVFDRF